jgi:hypothetical protein
MPLHRLQVALVLAALVLAASCTGARMRRETAAGLRDADALAARGCHACLVDALAIYQRLTPRDPALRAQVDRRVFRTSLLLALREKEIGLAAQAHLDRARTFADAHGAAADRERLDLADRLPWVATGQMREASMQQFQRLSALNDRMVARLTRAPLAGSDDPELDAYLDLSYFCTGRFRIEPARTLASFVPPGRSSPLLEYRAGACNLTEHASLDALLAAEPRFVEALFFIGRVKRDMSIRGGPRTVNREAVDALSRAHQIFPDSAASTMELAGLVRVRSPRDALPL